MSDISQNLSTIANHQTSPFTRLNDGTVILPLTPKPTTNLDRRLTSLQDPYRIIDIAHIIVNPSNPNIKGRLTLSIAPGKKDSRWDRDLQMDLKSIKDNGIKIIVCLLEWSEMSMLNISDYPFKAQESGFVFYHLPIRDRGIPQQKELDALVPIIVRQLTMGNNVLIHCRCGLGRAGTISACCLGHFGYDGINAITTVRNQRPRAIQTTKQEETIINYCHSLINPMI